MSNALSRTALADDALVVAGVEGESATAADARAPDATGGSPLLKILLITIDVIATTTGVVFAMLILGNRAPMMRDLVILSVIPLTILMMSMQKLYRARISSVRVEEIRRLLQISAVAAATVTLISHLADNLSSLLSPVDGAVTAAVLFVLLAFGRAAYDAWLRSQRARDRYCRRVAIVGTRSDSIDISLILNDHPEVGNRVVGLIGPNRDDVERAGLVWLGGMDDVAGRVIGAGASGALVGALSDHDRTATVTKLHGAGLHVHLMTGVDRLAHRRLEAASIAHEPLFYVEPGAPSRPALIVKRATDVVGAGLLLILCAPLLVLAAVAIKLSDGGPILYRQERVGKTGTRFNCFKLRSMRVDADKEERDSAANHRSGPLYKSADDPRVTRIGRLLRASSIDELPQLVNVLRGEMSLVGPRPALPDETEAFDDELMARNKVRPGITGLWQVEGRDNPAFAVYRRLDLFYVENWSLMLDFTIMVLTVQAVVTRIIQVATRRGDLSVGV